jgi:hypothetical protein
VHTRQLILRPAVELLFEKQRRTEKLEPSSEQSMDSSVQDSMLCKVAAQSVVCVGNLVDFLTTYIEIHSFDCWWYSISCKSDDLTIEK